VRPPTTVWRMMGGEAEPIKARLISAELGRAVAHWRQIDAARDRAARRLPADGRGEPESCLRAADNYSCGRVSLSISTYDETPTRRGRAR
jgi:hypothetical protein